MKWIGTAAAVLLIIACCMTWVIIPTGNITVSGIRSTLINANGNKEAWDYFGKPGYFHFIATFFFLLFTFTPRIWAKRANLFVTAVNLAWAVRNYFIVTLCRGGDCPEKHVAIYLVVLASLLMLVSALFPDFKKTTKTTMP